MLPSTDTEIRSALPLLTAALVRHDPERTKQRREQQEGWKLICSEGQDTETSLTLCVGQVSAAGIS